MFSTPHNFKNAVAFAALLVLFAQHLHAQHDFDSLYKASKVFKEHIKATQDTLDIFNHNSVLAITLETDFRYLGRNKQKREYQDAVLTYQYNDTVVVTREIEVKARGNFRMENCSNPPLKLNFPKKKAKLKQLQEFDKMKMVVNCKGYKTYEQYVLAEYLVYKTYNILTPNSFRVRLIKVTYIDSSGKRKSSSGYAFLIEDIDQLAQRMGGVEMDRTKLSPNMMKPEAVVLNDVFQYMIGNTDWSIPALHNMKLVKLNDFSEPNPYPIPYDFDYSGIINTSYAIPHESLPIESVRERLFRGMCHSEEEYAQAFQVFTEKKDAIYQVYEEFDLLDEKFKKGMLDYLDDFYEIINNTSRVKREILDHCR